MYSVKETRLKTARYSRELQLLPFHYNSVTRCKCISLSYILGVTFGIKSRSHPTTTATVSDRILSEHNDGPNDEGGDVRCDLGEVRENWEEG